MSLVDGRPNVMHNLDYVDDGNDEATRGGRYLIARPGSSRGIANELLCTNLHQIMQLQPPLRAATNRTERR